MKKNYFLRIAAIIIAFLAVSNFTGCKKGGDSDSISLSEATLAFNPEDGSQTVTVTSSGKWSVSTAESWVTVTPDNGGNKTEITITVSENEMFEDRKATVVFVCGNAKAELEVSQFGQVETSYVDMTWDKNAITGYDENSGAISVQCLDTPSVPEANSVIVLPKEYGYDIRIIKSSTVSGKTMTLQTEQGNMSNLFRNTSFTLSTDPSLASVQTKSGISGGVITPSEIDVMTENGYKKIYDRSTSTRDGYEATANIFSFNKDFSGTDLYNKNGQRVYWDKGIFDIGLKGVFSFDFGETVEGKVHWGKLDKFEYYLDGNLNVDLLLKYVITAVLEDSKENLIEENILPEVAFIFEVGGVPVPITVSTDLYNRYDLNASAEITMSAGCNIQANARMGLIYTPSAGVSPITSFTPSFTLYEPSFTAQGSLSAKGSIYPRIKFYIYKFAAPWVEPMSYLKEDFEGGMRASTDGNNYFGWTSKSYSGLDCRMGLNFDFFLFNKDVWQSDIFNVNENLLFDAPKKIELYSPVDGTTVTAGTPVDVTFYLSSLLNITGDYFRCPGALVNFTTQGSVDKLFAISDMQGLASVQWTPKDSNDTLTARIVDKDGNTISHVTFTPTYDGINGVVWAECNVDAPGTFAAAPESYGMFYQWNRPTAWPAIGDVIGWDLTTPSGDVWAAANDPCPTGWRVPTQAEQVSLFEINKVTRGWTTLNSVYGYRFTDITSGASIFLPAAGYRDFIDGSLNLAGFSGYYWSSSPYTSGSAYSMSFSSASARQSNSIPRTYGYSVRCVRQ